MELINFGETKDFAEKLQQDWLNACLAADIPAVTRDTAARLMAVLYVHGGGHEEMVMNRKFTNEMRYIQRRYGIEGGQRPDAEVVGLKTRSDTSNLAIGHVQFGNRTRPT